jgi:phytoene synthase
MLPGRSARSISAARVLYGRILDRIEAQNYDVFSRRASVPTRSKALMVARLLLSPRS